MEQIEIVVGDITVQRVDAVVNAANEQLTGGGGVDGAIRRAAGPELDAATRALAPCPPGDAVITAGYRLPARYVIHAVGPVWRGGHEGEDELLASCYRRSFTLARERDLESVAFPAISTGAYGFPFERAARLALIEIKHERERDADPEWRPGVRRVVVVLHDHEHARIYRELLAEVMTEDPSGP